MIGGIGLPELIVIFLVILLLFGAKALPEIAKGLGQAIQTFKKEARDVKESLDANEVSREELSKSSDVKFSSKDDFNPDEKKADWRPKSTGVEEENV